MKELWALVNNAGVACSSEIEWCPTEVYKRMMNVNALGVVHVTKSFLPLLKQSQGRVVIVSSLAGDSIIRVQWATRSIHFRKKHRTQDGGHFSIDRTSNSSWIHAVRHVEIRRRLFRWWFAQRNQKMEHQRPCCRTYYIQVSSMNWWRGVG